ncbi:hypothetical protein AGABI1DRAFT_32924 [Agaricus bisporus var. burnettii JB137-S8]|uniref:Uncharacterized protein n=1 Tax=Agaricus bisporus var. burnettii (strain JB137-S8 / ATCC MYA-4627 / FGSC 10392) TaxID=597362 RepID=K5X8Z6_AGABU|nr:uncharacterized protein AGABI1DRAFT_32924 [Agaricus bisporus var. burnettii JB137-S8]EKM84411.1 hypothetical protein AGABI1DRAFT_32924 [Agaricus bisporus var. burnettii JB137-S8]
MQKTEKQDSRVQLVFTAAHSTVAILKNHGISCAMFGSLACNLYGDFRHPKDVDVLVLHPPADSKVPLYSDEDLKKLIADADPDHYYLKLPRNPEAPYRILYYHEKSLDCKVDILTPGTMHLPNLLPPSSSPNGTPVTTTTSSPNPSQIVTISGIPLVPFSLLLLHKLQGWSDHRSAPEQFKRHKQHQDAADIRKLLAMSNLVKPLQQIRPWTDNELFSPEFQVLTRERVKEYCKEFPMRAESWKLLGLETE